MIHYCGTEDMVSYIQARARLDAPGGAECRVWARANHRGTRGEQEAGRGGRDGQLAHATVMWCVPSHAMCDAARQRSATG